MTRLLPWLGLCFAADAAAHIPVIELIGPGDDWCQRIQDSAYSDTFQFGPGDYYGPCDIIAPVPDNPGERLVIEPQDPNYPPIFHTDGVADYVIGLSGVAGGVQNVHFADLGPGDVAIEFSGEDMWFIGLHADGSQGTVLRQVDDAVDVEVLENDLAVAGGLPIRLGCTGCTLSGARVLDNLILGADLAIEATGSASAELRDNFIGEGRAGVLWTGSATEASPMETNLVVASEDGFRLVGGDIALRNNIVIGGTPVASIGPGRHAIDGNTLYATGEPLRLEGWGNPSGLAFRGNAVNGALPPEAGGAAAGNVVCTEDCTCWVDAEGWDFYPSPTSPLRGGGVATAGLVSDWCAHPRQAEPTAGALEALSVVGPGPVELVGREDTWCVLPPDPPPGEEPDPCGLGTGSGTGTGTGATTPTGTGVTDTGPERPNHPRKGCGCVAGGTGPGGGSWGLAAGLILLCARMRRRG